MTFVLNVLISSLTIGLAAWLSRRSAALAGFIIAMPLATMLVLPMAHLQHGELETSLRLARSIFLAIPVLVIPVHMIPVLLISVHLIPVLMISVLDGVELETATASSRLFNAQGIPNLKPA